MPSRLIAAYEHLLLHNLAAVATIESGIRNVTWLLPGRFADAEVASEGLQALLSLVSGYHDTLIAPRLDPSLSLPPKPFARVPSDTLRSAEAGKDGGPSTSTHSEGFHADFCPTVKRPGDGASTATEPKPFPFPPPPPTPSPPRLTPLLPPPTDHTRYTRFWTTHSSVYRRASRMLSVLGYVELLLEMLARKRGDRARWRVVLIIESVKTFLRLLLLRITRRPVLATTTPMREYDPATLPSEVLQTQQSQAATGTSVPANEPLTPHMRGSTLRNHVLPLSAALPESHRAHPLTLLPELDARGYLAEALNASATLVQVLLLVHWANRRPSTYKPLSLPTLSRALPPFLVPLLMRLMARRLRSPPSSSPPIPTPPPSDLLAQHHAALDRRIAAAFFLTGPMWVGWTRPKVQGWVTWLGKWPVLGLVGMVGEGYLPLVDDYFYYTSS